MTYPITQEDLKKFEKIVTTKENKPMGEEMREFLKVAIRIINEAYVAGYEKAVSEVAQNG